MQDQNDQDVRKLYETHAYPRAAQSMGLLGAGVAVRAHGATIEMSDGREVVDFASASFGYNHPTICERVSEQMRTMPLSSRMFLSRPLAMVVRKLAEVTPGELEVSYLCNSGAEAIEGALKLARGYHQNRHRMVAAVGAYHGSTLGALSACGIPTLRGQFSTLPLQTTLVPYGDTEALRSAVDAETAQVIIEPVAAGSGIRIPPPAYLCAVRDVCTRTGAILIADEITTGLGRTGKWFAVNNDQIVPDVMVIGGALGGGVLPVAAYVTTRKINGRVYGKRNPALHGSTTGGNPSACIAALSALEVIEEEQLAARAITAGKIIWEALERYSRCYNGSVLEYCGCGLLSSLRLSDEQTARAVQRRALERGVILRLDGLSMGQFWLGLRPPLTVSLAELEIGLNALEGALIDVLKNSIAASGA